VRGGATSADLSRSSDIDLNTSYPDHASNLDLAVDLYNSNRALLCRADSPGFATSIPLHDLAATTYYLKLDGVGFGDPTTSTPTGYTDDTSIGNYMISGKFNSHRCNHVGPFTKLRQRGWQQRPHIHLHRIGSHSQSIEHELHGLNNCQQ
jgi:hypothetical protein